MLILTRIEIILIFSFDMALLQWFEFVWAFNISGSEGSCSIIFSDYQIRRSVFVKSIFSAWPKSLIFLGVSNIGGGYSTGSK